MKYASNFVASFLMFCSVISHASTLELAFKVCELFNNKATQLETIFDPVLLTDSIRPFTEANIEKFRAEESRCESVELTRNKFPEASASTFTFNGTSRQMHVYMVTPNASGDRVANFLYVGALLPATDWSYAEESVAMRDGVKLRTRVYRPTRLMGYPTVLGRTPYFNWEGAPIVEADLATANFYLRQGYAYVYQSIRGTHGSEGEIKLFSPQEIEDGFDTVAWIRNQAWSNSRIAAVGTSYEGLTALAVAASNAPGVEVVIAGAGPTDMGSGTFSTYGILNVSALDYIHYLVTGQGVPFSFESPMPREETLFAELYKLASDNLDLRTYDKLIFGKELSEWNLLAEAFADPHSSYWKERSFIRELAKTRIPVIQLAGTKLDGNMPDTLNNFRYLESSPVASQHRLILGYWDHGNNTPMGSGRNMPKFVADRFNRWLAHYLKDEDNGVLNEKRIQLQSHKPGKWIGRDHWTETPAKTMAFALQAKDYVYDPLSLEDAGVSYDFEIQETILFNGLWNTKMLVRTDVPQTNVTVTLAKVDVHGVEQFLSQCAASKRLVGPGVHEFRPKGCFVFGEIKAGEKLRVTVFSNMFLRLDGITGIFLGRMTNRSPEDFWQTPLKAKIEILEPSAVELEIEP